ncbi:MAG: tRNA(adenine34) deaminase [bacterium]|jgi:tRNA(adenine34) deaminase
MVSPSQTRLDKQFMMQALSLAQAAGQSGEVPVGAIVVLNNESIGNGMNRCVMDHDPSAHAEVLALKSAAKTIQNFRLNGATLYVTLEPCLMCCGALLQARVARLVFGAREPRTGGVCSIHESLSLPGVEPHIAVTEGIYAEEASELLRIFFKRRR